MIAPHLLLALVLALPHVLYAFVWIRPGTWCKHFNCIRLLVMFGIMGKVLQFSSCLVWVSSVCRKNSCGITDMNMWEGIVVTVLLCSGQILNLATYKTLGIVGVYYGHKFGHRVSWVTTFPFSVLQNPQYVGSVLSIWGTAWVTHHFFPSDFNTQTALLGLTLFWSGLYGVSGWIENILD